MTVDGSNCCRWPQAPQRNAFDARSATLAVISARWPQRAQRIGQWCDSGSGMCEI
jgi:hypothetical protein